MLKNYIYKKNEFLSDLQDAKGVSFFLLEKNVLCPSDCFNHISFLATFREIILRNYFKEIKLHHKLSFTHIHQVMQGDESNSKEVKLWKEL